jgi:hypothetical protein
MWSDILLTLSPRGVTFSLHRVHVEWHSTYTVPTRKQIQLTVSPRGMTIQLTLNPRGANISLHWFPVEWPFTLHWVHMEWHSAYTESTFSEHQLTLITCGANIHLTLSSRLANISLLWNPSGVNIHLTLSPRLADISLLWFPVEWTFTLHWVHVEWHLAYTESTWSDNLLTLSPRGMTSPYTESMSSETFSLHWVYVELYSAYTESMWSENVQLTLSLRGMAFSLQTLRQCGMSFPLHWDNAEWIIILLKISCQILRRARKELGKKFLRYA